MRSTGYKNQMVDNSMGLGRSISILMPNELYNALDKIARRDNASKASLLRPLIERLVTDDKNRTAVSGECERYVSKQPGAGQGQNKKPRLSRMDRERRLQIAGAASAEIQ